MISHKALLYHAKSYLSADPKNSTDEYVSVLPMPWIMEQTYAVAKWCISRMKVNFVEEAETLFDDLREIGPTFILFGPRVWEQMAADIRSKIMDSSFIKRGIYGFSMKLMSLKSNFLIKLLCEFLVNRWLRDQLGLSFVKSGGTGGAALWPVTFKFFVNINQNQINQAWMNIGLGLILILMHILILPFNYLYGIVAVLFLFLIMFFQVKFGHFLHSID